MLSYKELKKYAIISGSNINAVKKAYDKAQKEANSVGKGKDENYVNQTLKDLLDIDESSTIQKLALKFTESDFLDFDKFLEELISSDIPQDVRPEMKVKTNVPENIDTTEDDLEERNLDGTGPEGKGPGTGRGLGNCNEEEIEEDLLINLKDKDDVLDNGVEKDNNLLDGCKSKK